MSVMAQFYLVIIYRGISAPGNGKKMVDVINSIGKSYIYQAMPNVQLMVSKQIDSHILIHSKSQNNDVSLEKEFQKHLSQEF